MSVTILVAPRYEESLDLRRAIHESDSEMARSGTEPPVSLAVFDQLEPAKACEAVSAVPSRSTAFSLRFSQVGFFHADTAVAFLQPEYSAELVVLHRRIHAALGVLGALCRPQYHPQQWHPHLTIAFPIPDEQCPVVESRIRRLALLRAYTFDRIEVVSSPPWKLHQVMPLPAPPNRAADRTPGSIAPGEVGRP